MAEEFTIALAGNPNSGKSTVFNRLTGGRQHVGNWPGKTVEKKEGVWRHDGRDIKVVDLPGTYSLTAYSLEEVIARDYIMDERPQVVVAVVDAANLERNLYLAVQILELGANMVIALNMIDMAEARGYKIDIAKLSEGLSGVPVVPTVASRGQGIEQLKERIIRAARSQPREEAAAVVEAG
jgi:ferrous iron transport protein B